MSSAIANRITAQDVYGGESNRQDKTSIANWNLREQWNTTNKNVTDDTLTIRERAIAAWPPAWHGQNLRDILVTLGYDVDTPWRDLPKKDRDWILFTEDTPTVPVYAGLTPEDTRIALKKKLEEMGYAF